MTLDELTKLARKFYGHKGSYMGTHVEDQYISFLFYDSFHVKFGFDTTNDTFYASLALSDNYDTHYFSGVNCCQIENNEKDIIDTLDIVDKDLRRRLPKAFLVKYDFVYRLNNHYLG